MKIREYSKITIIDKSCGRDILGKYIPSVDVEIEVGSIIVVDGGLYCIDSINWLKNCDYEFEVYWQDAILAKDGVLRKSISDD